MGMMQTEIQNPNPTFQLIQSRARLRKYLPVTPKDENGVSFFNFYCLEGYIFAIQAAPIEINPEVWGGELDRLMTEDCYRDEKHADDILLLYDDMGEALEHGQTFRIHTLQIPETMTLTELYDHPLWHWISGFLKGFSLVMSELTLLSRKKILGVFTSLD